MSGSLFERWADKVLVDDGCWEWTGGRSKDYGTIRMPYPGPTAAAHRLAYLFFCGPLPVHMDVLHHCDNPGCVRPSHLFLGTQADNNADRDAKGATGLVGFEGEQHGMAKLTAGKVRRMRLLYATEMISQPELARAFRVSQASVSNILLEKSWRNVL